MYNTMKKALNIKNMKETLVNFSGGDREEYDRIWSAFRDMRNLGFIDAAMWDKFWAQTSAWCIDDDMHLIDSRTGEIVFDFDNGQRNGRDYEEYRA